MDALTQSLNQTSALSELLEPTVTEEAGGVGQGLCPPSLTKYIVEARKENDYVFYCIVHDIHLIYSPMTRRQFKVFQTVERLVGPGYELFDVFGDNIFYPTRDMWEDQTFASSQLAGIEDQIKQVVLESSLFHSVEAMNQVKDSTRELMEKGDVEKNMDLFIKKHFPVSALSSFDDMNCYQIMEAIASIETIFSSSNAHFSLKTAEPRGLKRGG